MRSRQKGFVTVPADADEALTLDIVDKWGADAVRDCDGTKMPDALPGCGCKVYSTYFVSRNHNDFISQYPTELQEYYLLSEFKTATGDTLSIVITEGYHTQQIRPNCDCDIARRWEVVDRTSGETVPPANWSYEDGTHTVTIRSCKRFHQYTVTYLAYALWDSTQMYNHTVNNWGDVPHDMPFDIRKPRSQEYIYRAMREWLDSHRDVDVVRFTTFFYHFTLIFNQFAKMKIVDWTGYNIGVSVEAMEAFEAEYGYALRPEDIVDGGFYNSQFRVPTKAFRDYLAFLHKFATDHAKRLVDMVHAAGKKAMMFVGDNWMGIETHGERFASIGLDYVVTSVGSGVTERILADIEGGGEREGRFLPYFFPDVFCPDGDPVGELNDGWVRSRRAIMRKPLDRIGFGGYLKLAAAYPDFVDRAAEICDEFRGIKEGISGAKPYSAVKVAVLNAWGKLRSWQIYQINHAVYKRETYSYLGVLEALSGLPLDVSFISFDDVLAGGLEGVDVVINMGDGMTAYSGGAYWADERIVTALRAFVYDGGGFIGVGEPSALCGRSKYFQLSDVLGVDRELGQSLIYERYNLTVKLDFALEGRKTQPDFGEPVPNVYGLDADVLSLDNGQVRMACHRYGKGKSYYLTGLSYDGENAAMLYRACLSACGKEKLLHRWFSDNARTECHCYPDNRRYCVVNNSFERQTTTVYDGGGRAQSVTLEPMQIKWFTV